MSGEIRYKTTIAIWTALAIILIFTPADKIALAFILGIAAAVSTIVVWESSGSDSKEIEKQASKNKRDNRVRRLIEVMDEDEIAEMEDYLDARRDDRLRR